MKKTQLEIEGSSTNPELENVCKDYLDCIQEKESINYRMSTVSDLIIKYLKEEKRTSLKYLGYKFSIIESAEKLVCKEVNSNG